MRDRSDSGTRPRSPSEDFPEKKYRQRLAEFCSELGERLRSIDRDTDWRPVWYAPLDAQVEVRSERGTHREITDLQNAIRKSIRRDKTIRAFLLLGDPGSGKSVALRKLCIDMLGEVEHTDCVPLYVNLREWATERPWSQQNPPRIQDLYTFIVQHLKAGGDMFVANFVDEYFTRMLDHGQLFFVFDSFDEIPAMLDQEEGSWLLKELSEVIYKFIVGAHESRGLLASRLFRRPSQQYDAARILEIQPFTELRIAQALQRFPNFTDELLRSLFKERVDLVPIARNPFSATLLGDYVDRHKRLPAHQAEMYSDYVSARLSACIEQARKLRLAKDDIEAGAVQVAWLMFSIRQPRLETSVKQLTTLLAEIPMDRIIKILCYARIGRMGTGDDPLFTFVHRRFAEYFLALSLLRDPDAVPKDAIPTDLRWRDPLVLFAGLVNEGKAMEMAAYCWGEMQTIADGHNETLRGIHCLRFLRDAFSHRKVCIQDFQEELASFVLGRLGKHRTLLFTKFAVEAAGLLSEERLDGVLRQAVDLGNDWLTETTIKSCRHMVRPSADLELRVKGYINSLDVITFFRRRREFLFSFALSDSFRALHYFSRLRLVDAYLLLIGVAGAVFFSPYVVMLLGIGAILSYPCVLYYSLTNPKRSMSRDDLISASRILLPFVLLLGFFAPDKELTPFEMVSRQGLLYFIEDNHILRTWITAAIIPLSLPWYKGWYWIDKFHHRIMDVKARGWKRVVVDAARLMTKAVVRIASLVALMSVPVGFVLLVYWLGCFNAERPSDQCAVFYGLLMLVLTPVYGIMGYRGVLRWRNDRRVYHDIVSKESVSREDIEGSLKRLMSRRLTIKLLEHLDRRRLLRKGDWPEDQPVPLRMTILRLLKDWREYRHIPVKGPMSREQIAETISKLRTNHYRTKVVQDLERQRTVPSGAWPTDDLFNTTNDPAITVLARLEERWWELDR